MKRTISLALSLLLLLCLLPATAYAGGGGAALIWSEDFSTDPSEGWIFYDGNDDGYGFAWNSEKGSVESGVIVGIGLLPDVPQPGYDYLITPVIALREDEDVLSYDVSLIGHSMDVGYEIFVCPADDVSADESFFRTLRKPIYSDIGYAFAGGDWFGKKLDLTAWAGQSVRLVFRQRADVQNCSLALDNFFIYWNEPDEILDKVTAFDVPEPRIDRKVSECSDSAIVLPDGANYEVVPGSLRYYLIKDELWHDFNGTFQPKGEYVLSFQVKAKPGNTVDASGIASVNGKWARFIPEGSDLVRVEAYYSRLPDALDAVDITVSLPLAGRTPVREDGTTADPAKCVLLDHAFLKLDADGNPIEPLEGEAFELDKSYRIVVLLEPAEGWVFSNRTMVTSNGLAAQMNMTYEFEGYQVFSVDVTVDHVLFTDIPGHKWYTDAVAFCYWKGCMTGTGEYTFNPKGSLTRAMIVTILSKIDGADLSGYTGSHFSDVDPGKWYAKAVEWAYQNGYTSGTSEGIFSPNKPLNRQTLATFLYSYTNLKYGALEEDGWAELSDYPDGDRVSGWAATAMRWAISNNLISGTTGADGQLYLNPKGTASRAQVAVIVMKYCQYLDDCFAG